MFVEPKYPDWNYSSRLVTPPQQQHWLYNKQLLSAHCNVPRSLSAATPAPLPPTRVIVPDSGPCSIPLPHISEFSPGAQYASSSSKCISKCGSVLNYRNSLKFFILFCSRHRLYECVIIIQIYKYLVVSVNHSRKN